MADNAGMSVGLRDTAGGAPINKPPFVTLTVGMEPAEYELVPP